MGENITVQIVTFNSAEFMGKCLEGLNNQTVKCNKIKIIDNASDQKVPLSDCGTSRGNLDNISLITNSVNVGFAAAHNQGFREGESKYILVLNPDVYLDKEFVSELVNHLEADPSAGAACGKLLRMDRDVEKGKFNPTDIIDSTGIEMHRNRRAYDRGQGEKDLRQYNKVEYVFGASGAAVLYRKKMLEDTKIIGEYFDESFFTYKEDIDLAWRAQLKGWSCVYVPSAVAYHVRGWQPGKRDGMPRNIQVHSFKNRYLMLIKNESLTNLLLHLPWILSYEIPALIFVLFLKPFLLVAWWEVFRLAKQALHKRTDILNGKKASSRDIRKWMV